MKFSIFLFLMMFIIIGCGNNSSNVMMPGMGNPATENCIKNGGRTQIIQSSEGEYGICIFPDGSYCEEWVFLKGKCKKGELTLKCLKKGSHGEGWYDKSNLFMYKDKCE